jgi:peptidoglycan/LPS O-acetylase OafA/YrhL
MNNDTKIRLDIQAMRGIAVLAVVLFHANENFFRFGYLGVDIFFVISGYVVTPSVLRIFQDRRSNNKTFSKLIEFYKRRFLRLAPALGVALTLSSILILIFGNMQDHLRVARQGIATLLLAGNLGAVRYSGNYFSPNPNPFVHTWSLSVEEQIYLFLPLVLLIFSCIFGFSRKKQIISFALISFCSVAIFFVPQILKVLHTAIGMTSNFDATFYSSFSRLWEFGLGGLASFFLSKKITRKSHGVTLKNIFFVFCLLVVFLPKVSFDFYISCVAIALLSSISMTLKSLDILPKNILIVLGWFGDRSYSIYLFHMPLIYIAKYSPFDLIQKNAVLALCIALLFTITFGHLSYNFIENRFRLISNPRIKIKSSFRLSVIIAIAFPLSVLLFMDYEVRNNYADILSKHNQVASKDTHQAYLRGCIDLNFDPKKCVWPAMKSKGEILVVGDSQAYAVADGVIKAGRTLAYDVLVSSVSGCPFLGLDTTGAKSVNCLRWQNDIFNYIKSEKPNFVFIANRTNGYLNPDSGWRVLLDENGKEIIERKSAIEAYRVALTQSIRSISKNSRVILVQNISEPGFLRSSSLLSKLLDRDENKSRGIDLFSNDSSVSIIEQNVVASATRANLLNPVQTLCPNGHCILREKGTEVYMDSWHLSTFGSIKLANQIKEIILLSASSS